MSEIHISDVRAYRQCRRKWYWSSPLRMNLEPIVVYAPFFVGRAVHAALEFYYGEDIPFDDTVDAFLDSEEVNLQQLEALWPAEEAELDEMIFLIRDLIDHYRIWVAQDDSKYADKNLEFVSMEQEFEIPMPVPGGGTHRYITVAGRFDGIVRHKLTDRLWVWETKTARSIANYVNGIANDEQCSLYVYAARQIYGDEVVGMLFNLIGKTPPRRPPLTKAGLLSQNKQYKTSSYYYRSVIKEEFPDWEEDTIQEYYGAHLDYLKEKDPSFFMRYPAYRTDRQLQMTMEGLYWTGLEMLSPLLYPYPSPGWTTCNFCSFKAPCYAMDIGAEYQVLLREEYQERVSATSMREEEGNDE